MRCPSTFEFRGHEYRCEQAPTKSEHTHQAKLIDGDHPSDYVSWTTDGRESFVFETIVLKETPKPE